jgi:hypothetical protein
MAYLRQPRPDSGLGFQVQVLKTSLCNQKRPEIGHRAYRGHYLTLANPLGDPPGFDNPKFLGERDRICTAEGFRRNCIETI